MHADQPLELLCKTGHAGRAARQDDLADAQASGLVLVELKRGDELACERLHLTPNRVERLRSLVVGQARRRDTAVEREASLDRLDLGRRAVENTRKRDVQRPAAPLENACELADAAVADRKRGSVVTDGDCDERS